MGREGGGGHPGDMWVGVGLEFVFKDPKVHQSNILTATAEDDSGVSHTRADENWLEKNHKRKLGTTEALIGFYFRSVYHKRSTRRIFPLQKGTERYSASLLKADRDAS